MAPPAVVHLAAEGAAPREGARTDRRPTPLAPGPNHASRMPQPDRPKAMCDGQLKPFCGDFLRSTFLYPNGLEHPRSGIACNNPFAFHTLIRGQTLSSIARNVNLDAGFCRDGVPITAASTASRLSCNNMEMDSVALTFISPPRRGPPIARKVKTPLRSRLSLLRSAMKIESVAVTVKLPLRLPSPRPLPSNGPVLSANTPDRSISKRPPRRSTVPPPSLLASRRAPWGSSILPRRAKLPTCRSGASSRG